MAHDINSSPLMDNLPPREPLRDCGGTSRDAHTGWLTEQTQRQPRDRGDFKIAIICALPLEFDAICLLLDKLWDNHGLGYGRAPNDYNYYTTGRLGIHNVVLLLLPGMGKAHAASAARGLRISFPDVRLAVLIGICGGVPIEWKNGEEILLGDVIVSERLEQFDMGKHYPDGFQTRTDRSNSLGKPAKPVMSLIAGLTTQFGRARLQQRTAFFLGQLQRKAGDLGHRSYAYPGTSQDKLFNSNYPHQHYSPTSCSCGLALGPTHRVCDLALLSSCVDTGCDEENLISRVRLEMRQSLEKKQDSGFEIQQPAILFGVIASGDTVMKSGPDRDRIAKRLKALAFEMEGAGLWEELPSIVVKGVCDYADSHKNKKWQDFAAATAAAVTCAILERYERNDNPRAGVLENPIVEFMHPMIGGLGQQHLARDDFPLQDALQVLPTEICSILNTRFNQETISTEWAETILAFLESRPEVSKTFFVDDQACEQVAIEHETVSLSVLGFLVRKDKKFPKPSKKQARGDKKPPSLEEKLGNTRVVEAAPLDLNDSSVAPEIQGSLLELVGHLNLNGAPVVISICHGEWLKDDCHHQSSQFLADLYSGGLTKNVQVQLITTVTAAVTPPPFLSSHQVLSRETETNCELCFKEQCIKKANIIGECLSLLKFEGQFLRRDEVSTAELGTNDWIWEHQAFISWAQKSSGILWIEGKAGCGKYVLAKTIRSKIGQTWKSRLQGVPLPPISDWFYSTRHGDTTKSHILCLRSFLSQILQQNKASFHQYSSIYRQKGENQEKWTIDDYEGILLSLASQGIPAVCIIDAMDESDDSGGTYELRSRIINLMAKLCRETRSCLRFIVTSRYTADMNRALRKLSRDGDLLSLVVLEKENRQDIAIFIASSLKSLNDAIDAFKSESKEEIDFTFSTSQGDGEAGILARIGEYIAENADSVILWVKLVMDALIG
ncbi:hypothetical protein ANO14919_102790 [Xylariales sp. No.14919]|nr:hypothetical protein ANO14919_102790 [Xylariales sp. No.14919]